MARNSGFGRTIMAIFATAAAAGCGGYGDVAERTVDPTGYTVSRSFLPRQSTPPAGYGAYAYVVLPSPQSPERVDRYTAFCESYLRMIAPTSEFSDGRRHLLMPMFWILRDSISPGEDETACNRLLDGYDYARGQQIARTISKLDVPGPVLVAWSVAHEPTGPVVSSLVVDLSTTRATDFDRALQLWHSRLARDPAQWQNGFRMERAREVFRDLTETYGLEILSVIRPKAPE